MFRVESNAFLASVWNSIGDPMVRHVLLAMAILAPILGCRAPQEPAVVPADLHGVWKTTDSRYEGRFFELTVNTVTLGTGEDRQETYPIRTVETRRETRATAYALTYMNPAEGAADTLVLHYEPRDGGVIRFGNQPNVEWRKGSRS